MDLPRRRGRIKSKLKRKSRMTHSNATPGNQIPEMTLPFTEGGEHHLGGKCRWRVASSVQSSGVDLRCESTDVLRIKLTGEGRLVFCRCLASDDDCGDADGWGWFLRHGIENHDADRNAGAACHYGLVLATVFGKLESRTVLSARATH